MSTTPKTIKMAVGECPWCGASCVLFNGISYGAPCHKCGALYGVAKNLQPAGVVSADWLKTREAK